MTRTKIIAITTVGLLTAGALYAGNGGKCGQGMGEGCHKGMFMKRGGEMKKVFKELDLTDTQKEQLKEMRMAKKEQRKAMKGQRGQRGMKIAEAIDENGFNKAKFIESAKAGFETRIANRADDLEKMFKVLTPEQQQKFVTVMKEKNQ